MPKTRELLCTEISVRVWQSISYKKGGVEVRTPRKQYRYVVRETKPGMPCFQFTTVSPDKAPRPGERFRARTYEWDKKDMWACPHYERLQD